MKNENKNILRRAMRHVNMAKISMSSFDFKEAYSQMNIAYIGLQQLANEEKMNTIE